MVVGGGVANTQRIKLKKRDGTPSILCLRAFAPAVPSTNTVPTPEFIRLAHSLHSRFCPNALLGEALPDHPKIASLSVPLVLWHSPSQPSSGTSTGQWTECLSLCLPPPGGRQFIRLPDCCVPAGSRSRPSMSMCGLQGQRAVKQQSTQHSGSKDSF